MKVVIAMGEKSKPKSFLIRIVDNQNATWQGNVIWVEKNETQSFRSALELIKMIDGAVENGDSTEKDEEN